KTLVETETKRRFRNLAKTRGLSESELLRSVVLVVTGQDAADLPIEPEAENSELERMTVRLPGFLMDAAKQRGKSKGMAASRWVAALVQANLTGKPVMTDKELAVLQASNRELAAIGRNINQIAKALNEAFHETERVRLDTLAALNQSITENRAAIHSLVRASQQAWEAKNGVD
ncbi:MAG: plasmid mobilization relaxosome protein MobC, partial [Methylobacter tundripaludum]|nr:plasmid mobilization relaxosome protein MobC [Methylobacter tundripaludum]